jgi:subtilisin family serine protease
VTVADLDTDGVAPDPPDLSGTLTDGDPKIVVCYDFVNMQNQVVGGIKGDHATQVAGAATAAFDNGEGMAGVAPNCHLIGVRIPSTYQDTELNDILLWAAGIDPQSTTANFPAVPERPADVLVNAWGRDWHPLSTTISDCFDDLTTQGRSGHGCVLPFAVGNFGYQSFSSRRYYAADDRTIAVGASIHSNPSAFVASVYPDHLKRYTSIPTKTDSRALYCPYGVEMDVVAPSSTSHVLLAKGSPLAEVDPITCAVRRGKGSLDGSPGRVGRMDYDETFGGTSHATAVVGGAAALVLSADASLSWYDVRQILRETAERIDDKNTDPLGKWYDKNGSGNSDFSQWYGYGRIDVDRAVKEAIDRKAQRSGKSGELAGSTR